MPANLTPQYRKAERAYRQAQSSQDQIAALELMLQEIPKHKGTDRLQGELRARLKEAREQLQAEKSAPRPGRTYRIPRQAAGTVVILGGPNAGKSRLVAALTNAQPEIAPYPFTTREPLAAMMSWEDIRMQLIDTPPITASHIEPYLTGFVRSADAVVLCVDGSSDDAPQDTLDLVQQLRPRKTILSDRTGFDEDDFSIAHIRTLVCVTRGHDPGAGIRLELLKESGQLPLDAIVVDLLRREHLELLRASVAGLLSVVRIYTKRPGQAADFESPITLPRDGTVADLAERIHEDLAATVKLAKVWPHSGGAPQSVGREHVLHDRDIVELHA